MKFWKDNKLNQEWEIHPEEILDKFLDSIYFKQWQEGYPIDRELPAFLCSKDGLSSVYEQEDYEKLREYVLRNYKSRLIAKTIIKR